MADVGPSPTVRSIAGFETCAGVGIGDTEVADAVDLFVLAASKRAMYSFRFSGAAFGLSLIHI